MNSRDNPGHATAQELNTRLRNSRTFPFPTRIPGWYGQLIASLVHFTDGKALRYTSSEFAEDASQATVVVFTDDLVIVGSISGGENGWLDAEFDVKAWSRSALSAMSVKSEYNMYSQSFSDWPGSYQVTLHYGEHGELSLPLSRWPMDAERTELDTLVPRLRDDLGR